MQLEVGLLYFHTHVVQDLPKKLAKKLGWLQSWLQLVATGTPNFLTTSLIPKQGTEVTVHFL